MSLMMTDSFTAPVIIILAAIAVSTAVQLLTGTAAAAVLIAGFSLLCGAFPVTLCTMPLLLYDALWEKKWWLTAPAALALIKLSSLTAGQIMITLAAAAVAVIIYIRVSGLEQTVTKLTDLRDEVAGKNQQLAQQKSQLGSQNQQRQQQILQLAPQKFQLSQQQLKLAPPSLELFELDLVKY